MRGYNKTEASIPRSDPRAAPDFSPAEQAGPGGAPGAGGVSVAVLCRRRRAAPQARLNGRRPKPSDPGRAAVGGGGGFRRRWERSPTLMRPGSAREHERREAGDADHGFGGIAAAN